jgi:transcriptional regulator with XRE-family HTH domain
MGINVGENIRQARIAKGWNQTVLGEKLGIAQKQVSRIEEGESSPTVARLILIAEALGVEPGSLLRKNP